MASMESDSSEEQENSTAFLTGIKFHVSNDADNENMSILEITAPSEVSDPRLGFPNFSNHCTTCDARDMKQCEGHFGVIKFPYTILHPFFLSEVVHILNKICPGCKSIRKDLWMKGANSIARLLETKGCKYCVGNSIEWYPPMRFKITSKELFRKSAIMVEVSENSLMKVRKRGRQALPADYWDFIPKDQQQEEGFVKPGRRVLSHAQVRHLLKDVDPEFIKKFISEADSIFLNCFPVTPNSHRVTEIMHTSSNAQRLIFDERTRVYKKLVDFRGLANELSSHVLECLKISKLHVEKPPFRCCTSLGAVKMKVGRYAVLLAARDSEYVERVYGGYFNVFIAAFGEEGERWDLFRVVDDEFPDMSELYKYDGFVISGSPYDAYGNDYWILKLCFLLQTLDAMEKKVLGICFGHQVLCRSLGGKVGKACSGWDIGLRTVKVVKDLWVPSSLEELDEMPSSLSIIECHQDEVFEVPMGAQVVAFSEKTGVEMFVIGQHILGIQGHPEYTRDILYNIIDRLLDNNSIQRDIAEKAKFGLETAEPDRKSWEKICRDFLKRRQNSSFS